MFYFFDSAINNNKLILNQLSGSVAAYSLRKLKSTSTNAIRVRRSNDNAELNIPFCGNDLCIATLTAFVGANSGFVTTMYDQSGNGRHAVQTTAGSQPVIVNAGTLYTTANGKPTIKFLGGQYLTTSYAVNGNFSVVSVAGNSRATLPASNQIDTIVSAGRAGGEPAWLESTTYNAYIDANNRALAGTGTKYKNGSTSPLSLVLNELAVLTSIFTGINITSGQNTLLIGAGYGASGTLAFTAQNYISEIIDFNFILPVAQRQTIERNQGKYYGIGVI